ncbi:Ig-like domain-containing protein [Streptomyces goshikiensis]|uniref:Ig-like domain-containing protein n=1 Tax=Streptomyces goshikiensis TaxID=1942 RepID=UPI003687EC15
MSGDPTKANLWTDADVYISTNLSAAVPANASTAFGVDWTYVGLLDGDDGMPESRDEDTDDKYAWGGMLVRTSRQHFKLTKSFTALEDNATTFSLLWPGSTSTAIKVPRPTRVLVAFEVRDGAKVRRLITAQYAEVVLDGDHGENESDLESATFVATIFPTSDGTLFNRQTTPTIASLAVSPATKTLTVGAIGGLVATATFSDASTAIVTGTAAWSTSAPSKATVAYGYVTAVASGSATITATYLGQSGTCAVTVS